MRTQHMLATLLVVIIAASLTMSATADAQLRAFSREDMLKFTSQWDGERFPDGRPKVPDEVLEKLKTVVIDDAILVLKDHGYFCQYEDGWNTNQQYPTLVGRAVTGVFMPERPDVKTVIDENAADEGISRSQNGRVVEVLQENDVVVADLWGEITNTFAGGGVSGRISQMTGNTGLVIDGGCLDKEEIHKKLPGFTIYNRGWHPTHLSGVMLTGLNTPVRIGQASVMPGDVVLGGYEGVLFIPPHLAQEIVDRYAQ